VSDRAYTDRPWGETRKAGYRRLYAALETERSSYDGQWKDIGTYLRPNRARFNPSDGNRGDRRWKSIIDSTGTMGARTLASGMMSHLTSPARPWCRLTVDDYELAEYGPVKLWLDDVTDRIMSAFARSNFYDTLPTIYGDMGVFGTGAMMVLEDPRSTIRCVDFPIGSYVLANDGRMLVGTFARKFRLTVRQIIQTFGLKADGRSIDWSRLSTRVRDAWNRGNADEWIEVTHVIEENPDADPKKLPSKYKPFRSCYFETAGTDDEVFLEEKGFDEFPVMAPRWDVAGEDVYGTECPGMLALGHVKQLQVMERRGLQAIEKMVNPPLIAPAGFQSIALSQLPGDVSYGDETTDRKVRSIYEKDFRVDLLEQKMQSVRSQLDDIWFRNLFLMLDQLDRPDITATEVLERKQEKLLALGPVVQRTKTDLLDRAIDRTFNILDRAGDIPEAPEELQGQTLKVEYISIMAQAQKEVGVASIERTAMFAVNIFKETQRADVLDKLNFDELIDEHADRTGVPTRIIVPDEQVAAVRQSRAKQQAMAQAAEQASTMAGAAQSLASADTSGKNALTDLMQNVALTPTEQAA
jgi:hypothetical protein